jgi:hypothetical protein
VAAEIDNGHPMGIRIGWHGGGGHFVVIYGYRQDSSDNYYYVDDPIYGRSPPLAEEDLRTNYQFAGDWTHSYYTRPGSVATSVTAELKRPTESTQQLVDQKTTLQLADQKVQPQPVGFKLAPIDERYTALAERARPFLDTDRAEQMETKGKKVTLAVPHNVYVAGMKQLATSPNPLPEQPSGTRILEMADGQVLATYDIAAGNGKPPSLIGGRRSQPFVNTLSEGLQLAVGLSERTKETPELRVLTAPALYFEALWLHYDNPSEDKFIPILSSDIALNKPIDESSLIRALRMMAQKRIAAEQQSSHGSAP